MISHHSVPSLNGSELALEYCLAGYMCCDESDGEIRHKKESVEKLKTSGMTDDRRQTVTVG